MYGSKHNSHFRFYDMPWLLSWLLVTFFLFPFERSSKNTLHCYWLCADWLVFCVCSLGACIVFIYLYRTCSSHLLSSINTIWSIEIQQYKVVSYMCARSMDVCVCAPAHLWILTNLHHIRIDGSLDCNSITTSASITLPLRCWYASSHHVCVSVCVWVLQ